MPHTTLFIKPFTTPFITLLRKTVVLCALVLASLILQAQLAEANAQTGQTVRVPSAELGRGINLGGIMEAPFEGAWGLRLRAAYFKKIKAAGFDHVRLPVSWTFHTARTPPYRIDRTFFRRIDFAIDQALSNGLKIIINNHHYDELNADPVAERRRALAIWRQIARRYRNQPDAVLFEFLNEPHGVFNDQPLLWNQLFEQTLSLVRRTNPTRKVLVGPVFWNDIGSLSSLELPDDDNLIVSVHNYAPFNFTHQGASWIEPTPPVGERWSGRRVDILQWQNWSWNTRVASGDAGMRVKYQSPGAGYFFHNPNGIEDPVSLVFHANRRLSLNIEISNNLGFRKKIAYRTRAGQRRYSIPMTRFDSPSLINFVLIQNADSGNVPAWLNRSMFIKSRGGRVSQIVSTQRKLLDNWIDRAAVWASDNNRPLHLGEFGVLDRANFGDRVRWTKAVRLSAEARGIDWSYWEFAFNFGIYDPETRRFRQALVKALIP